jgi:hypothetical protein
MKFRPLHLLFLAIIVGMIGCRDKTPTTTTIPVGFDLFQTDPETTFFNFEKMPIPAGFFAADSKPFTGTVKFRGGKLPSSYFDGEEIRQVDTIVKREQPLTLSQSYPAYGTTSVEMIALALISEEPIKVQAGNGEELWDVVVELSKHRPSRGTMSITKTDAQGGTFESQLVVYPVFRFIRQDDGAEKILDVGTLELTKEMQERFTLRASQVPWRHIAPPNVLTIKGFNDNFIAGAPARFKEDAEACAHGAQEPAQQPPALKCTLTATRDNINFRFKATGDTDEDDQAKVTIHLFDGDIKICSPVNTVPGPSFLPEEKTSFLGRFIFSARTVGPAAGTIPAVGAKVIVKISQGSRIGHCCAEVVETKK